MQLDMHYHGTFGLARAAGLNLKTAHMIASCAEFVDDNIADENIALRDGGRVDSEATAHHTVKCANLSETDQRQVWVPFHFLPGNQGASFTERLKCRKDSKIARELVDHHLTMSNRSFGPALMGVTAHVYADTFSHYGFSGVSSRRNKVHGDSFEFSGDLDPDIRDYITKKAKRFRRYPGAQLLANIKSTIAEVSSGALGHGGVATYPDRPYLAWSFDYEIEDAVEGRRSVRDNKVTFMEACEQLHEVFSRFGRHRPDLCELGVRREFDEIRAPLAEIIAVQGPRERRVAAWQETARAGVVFGRGEKIPPYPGHAWNDQWVDLDRAPSCDHVFGEPVWEFYQAAAVHRTYVLRDLLPRHGLIVD